MTADLDALELQLGILGRLELGIEQRLLLLKSTGRSAATAGDFETSDAIWRLHADLKSKLDATRLDINRLEAQLYMAPETALTRHRDCEPSSSNTVSGLKPGSSWGENPGSSCAARSRTRRHM